MSIRDNVEWCQKQIDNARDTLAGHADGHRMFANGVEITADIGAKARQIIADRTRLIAAYLRLR